MGSCVYASDSDVSSVGSSTPTKTNKEKIQQIRKKNEFKRQKKSVQKSKIESLANKLETIRKEIQTIDAQIGALLVLQTIIDDLSKPEHEETL
jgi:hypothetical protein